MRSFTRHSLIAAAVFGAVILLTGCPGTEVADGGSTTPAALSATPGGQDFGKVFVGDTSAAFSFTIKNSGQDASGAPTVALSGTDKADFKIGANTCTAAVGGGESCTVSVTFSPTAGTTPGRNAILDVTAAPGGTASVALTGTAQTSTPAQLTVSTSLQDYGSVGVTTSSSSVSFVVTNRGGSPSGVPAATLGGANAGDFSITSNGCTVAIPADGTCTVGVRFSPTALLKRDATLTVVATPGNTVTVTLTGFGISMGGISISPTPNDFGQVVSGATSPNATFTVTNNGNVATGALSASITGTNATQFGLGTNGCTTLAPGATCTIQAHFSPTSPQAATASLTVTGTPGGTVAAALAGLGLTPPGLTITPNFFDFGPVPNSTSSASVAFTVKNIGGVPTAALTSVLGGTDASSYLIAGDGCVGSILAANATCNISIRFAPTTTGAKAGSITVGAGAGVPAVVATLAGSGQPPGQINIAPSPQVFGSVSVGSASAGFTFTVTNTGGTPTPALTTALAGANAADFVIVGNGCSGLVVPAAGTCTMTVTFNPTSAGAKAATLTANGGAAGIATATLSGTGLSPAFLAVNPTSADFGSSTTNVASSNVVFTVTNTGGTASGTPTVGLTGANGNQFTLVANGCTAPLTALTGSCTVTVNFLPTTAGTKTASLNIAATPGNTLAVALTGVGVAQAQITVSPSPQDFGQVFVTDSSSVIDFTVTNTGAITTGPVSFALSGANAADFTVGAATGSGTQCNLVAPFTTLAAGITCRVGVTYTPLTAGGKNASLAFTAAPGGTATTALTGSSTSGFNTVAGTYDFGSQSIGTTTPVTFTWKNKSTTAAASVTTVTLGGNDPTQFVLGATNCVTGSPIPAGGTCTVVLSFKPLALSASTFSATVSLAFTGGIGSATDVLTVSGTGVPALYFDVVVPSPVVVPGFADATTYNYGPVLLGKTGTKTFAVKCAATAGCGMVTTNLAGATTEYAVTSDGCAGSVLGNGGTCNIAVLFYPATVATGKAATLMVTSQADPLDTQSLNLLGDGAASQTLSVTAVDSFDYGSVGIGDSLTQTFTVTNAAGSPQSSPIAFSVTNVIGAGFAPVAPVGTECISGTTTLAASASCDIVVKFKPVLTNGDYTGSLSVNAAIGAPTVIVKNLTGTGTVLLTMTPTTNDFGSVKQQTTTSTAPFVVTNNGTSATGSLAFTLVGADSTEYTIVGSNCPVAGLAPSGGTCTANVNFAPKLGHALVATAVSLKVQDNGTLGRNAAVDLTGTEVAGDSQTFTVSPGSQDFGATAFGVAPGTNLASFTFKNNGNYTTGTITRAVTAGSLADFVIDTDSCVSGTLAPGSCTVTAHFLPVSAGAKSVTLTWTTVTAVPGGILSAAVTLTGTGVASGGIVISPTPDTFGALVTTTSASRDYTVTNTAGAATAAMNMAAFSDSSFTYDVATAPACPVTAATAAALGAGATCNVKVKFTPATVGLKTTHLATTIGTASNYSVLTGTGVNQAAISFTPAAPYDYGYVQTGSTGTKTFVVKNNGDVTAGTTTVLATVLGGTDPAMFAVDASSTCGDNLDAGASCNLVITFNPTLQGAKSATLTVSATPGGSQVVALSGNGAQAPTLAISPSSGTVDFGNVSMGDSGFKTFTISNSLIGATTGAITASDTATTGEFSIDPASTCVPVLPATTKTLGPNGSCTFIVKWTPTGSLGLRSAVKLSVTANPGGTVSHTNIIGTAVSALTVAPATDVALSAVAKVGTTSGTSASTTFVFTNNGAPTTGPLTTVLAGAAYSITANTCANATLADTQTCSITVKFQPTATGATTATVTVAGTPGNSVDGTITGTGT